MAETEKAKAKAAPLKLHPARSRDPSRALSARILAGTDNVAGIYDEIVHGHPDALKGLLSMRVRFAQTAVRVAPVDDELETERLFRDRCERVVASMIFDLRRSAGVSDAIERLADAIVYGCATYEVTWTRDDMGAPTVNLSPIPLHFVQRWERENGRAVPVVNVEGAPVVVPFERLIHIAPVADAGPQGVGILRPLVFPYELWKSTMEDMGLRARKEAGGLLVHATAPTVDDAQAQSVIDVAAGFAAGDSVAALLPYGYTATAADLPPASSKLDVIEYCDQKIRAMFDDALASLVSSDKGSRALGEAVSESADADETQTIEYLVGRFGRALFSHVALAFGYVGRMPSLTSVPAAQEDDDSVIRAMTAAAPLTGWFESDRDAMRERLGMAPVLEAGGKIELAPSSSLMMARGASGEDPPDIVDTPGLIAGRNKAEARLREVIGMLADELRQDAVAMMADGVLSDDERAALSREYLPRLLTEIHAYAEERRQKAFAWGQRLVDRSQREGLVEGPPARDPADLAVGLAEAMLRSAARVDDMASVQARTIFQRVVGEVESQYSARGDADEIPETQITDKGLAEGAAGVGHAAEQSGRMEGAANAAGAAGLVLTGAWRASFEDSNRCRVCRAQSQTFHPVDDLPQLPDPECLGGVSRCRCGLVPVFARVEQ